MHAKRLVFILGTRRFLGAALAALAAYVLLYLAAAQYLIVAPGEADSLFAFRLLPGWRELVLRQRAPFLFEPIGALHVGPFFRALGLRGVRGLHSLIGTIPALVSGAACCVPTLILVVGLQLTATLATVWSWLVPVSALLLAGSLWWSLHRMPTREAAKSLDERRCRVDWHGD